jgi:muramoyltetrapeptide carboxypeptidase
MIRPEYLKTGDSVIIISTARKVNRTEIKPAIDLLSSVGIKCSDRKKSIQVIQSVSGTDEERMSDLQTSNE